MHSWGAISLVLYWAVEGGDGDVSFYFVMFYYFIFAFIFTFFGGNLRI